jgi:hypothetical protein
MARAMSAAIEAPTIACAAGDEAFANCKLTFYNAP